MTVTVSDAADLVEAAKDRGGLEVVLRVIMDAARAEAETARELEAAALTHGRRADAGRAGAAKRWRKMASDGQRWPSIATQCPPMAPHGGVGGGLPEGSGSVSGSGSDLPSDPLLSSDPDPDSRGRAKVAVGYSQAFQDFWQVYPRKVGKGAAWRAWAAPAKELGPNVLCMHAQRALAWQRTSLDWTKDGGSFVPHPATYLAQRRWEDEPTVQVPRLPEKTERNLETMRRWDARKAAEDATADVHGGDDGFAEHVGKGSR